MSARVMSSAASLRTTLARPARTTPALARLGAQTRRLSGPYGYTQAKALVFSETGEPKDALKSATPGPVRIDGPQELTLSTASISTPSRPPSPRPASSSAPSPPLSTPPTSTPSRAPTARSRQ
ncbi:hypothetical protein IMZ48_05605 [Candidatus Bathyarchaeota archaeon]|nr:hypothetical protein [Candidatus Bathyarchaeota archaeon]